MKPSYPQYLILVLLVAALIASGRYLHAEGLFDLAAARDYLRGHPFESAFWFVAIYALFVLSFVPTLPLNLAAGLLWGGATGGILATFGATAGSVCAFLAARTLLGPLVVGRLRRAIPDWLRDPVNRLGWRAVAFCRLNPTVPTCLVNYVFGVTALPFGAFLWSTFVFFLPATIAIAVIGEQTQTFIVGSSTPELINSTVTTLTAMTLLLGIAWVARLPKSAVKQEE